jgi:hypothetical protein
VLGVGQRDLQQRVTRSAEAVFAEQRFVSPIDVLIGLGWLAPTQVDRWRQGRVDCLEHVTQASLSKIGVALAAFQRWAQMRGLTPSETDYVARTRDRRVLRFSVSGDPAIECAYRTHWVSPDLPERKREGLAERLSHPPDLLVISSIKDWTCTSCRGTGDFLFMEDQGPLCLHCADLGHLVFLPAGDAALTRRSKRASRLSAVVVRWRRSAKRYERVGILAEEEAIDKAEIQCLSDSEARARRRTRDEQRRAKEDRQFQTELVAEIARAFPGCPTDRAHAIAHHTGTRGSGRVGRTAAGRALDQHAILLAVEASVRHVDTRYDELLMSGVGRAEAREQVRRDVDNLMHKWRTG